MVSLFVRLWVEMLLSVQYTTASRSASSWGCELKYLFPRNLQNAHDRQPLREAVSWNKMVVKPSIHRNNRQPLREAVSWNKFNNLVEMLQLRQPLREAVSWNIPRYFPCKNTPVVSLFVRLWVEILLRPVLVHVFCRQPLREAVSWNTIT